MKFAVINAKRCLNPQGKVVRDTLLNIDIQNLKKIRQGKFFEIEIEETDIKKAENKIIEMCEKLLVNLIIEDYKINKL